MKADLSRKVREQTDIVLTFTGNRCYGYCDWQVKGRINAIGAVIDFKFLTVSLFDNNINSDIFYAWITQDLLPKVPDNSVLIMDNAAFHKRNDIKNAVINRNIILEYLPPYSPDLNPIEKNGLNLT